MDSLKNVQKRYNSLEDKGRKKLWKNFLEFYKKPRKIEITAEKILFESKSKEIRQN